MRAGRGGAARASPRRRSPLRSRRSSIYEAQTPATRGHGSAHSRTTATPISASCSTSDVSIEPRPAGPLADILTRRRIAVGIDERRRPVLARPDSLLVRVDEDGRRRDKIAAWVDGWDHDQAERIATPDE